MYRFPLFVTLACFLAVSRLAVAQGGGIECECDFKAPTEAVDADVFTDDRIESSSFTARWDESEPGICQHPQCQPVATPCHFEFDFQIVIADGKSASFRWCECGGLGTASGSPCSSGCGAWSTPKTGTWSGAGSVEAHCAYWKRKDLYSNGTGGQWLGVARVSCDNCAKYGGS